MAKSQPTTIRLRPDVAQRVAAMAKRSGRSKSAVLENLIDEAERERRYPGIRFSGPETDRRASLADSNLDIWQVIRSLQDWDNDAERMCREAEFPIRLVEIALEYYREFPEEIDEFIAMDRRPIEQLRREYPFAHVVLLDVQSSPLTLANA